MFAHLRILSISKYVPVAPHDDSNDEEKSKKVKRLQEEICCISGFEKHLGKLEYVIIRS
jgi:hypothetical protein